MISIFVALIDVTITLLIGFTIGYLACWRRMHRRRKQQTVTISAKQITTLRNADEKVYRYGFRNRLNRVFGVSSKG